MKNIPCDKLKSMIKEETESAKEYDKYGLNGIAVDERRHAGILRKIHKKRCAKK